jgi:hypothetical protein
MASEDRPATRVQWRWTDGACECDEERAGKRGGRMVEFVTADAREEPESLARMKEAFADGEARGLKRP